MTKPTTRDRQKMSGTYVNTEGKRVQWQMCPDCGGRTAGIPRLGVSLGQAIKNHAASCPGRARAAETRKRTKADATPAPDPVLIDKGQAPRRRNRK